MELTRISPANGLTYGFVCLTLLASVWGHSIDDVVPCFHDELTSTIAPFRRMPTQSSTAGVKGRQGTRQTSPVGDIMRVKTIYQLDSLDQHFASDPTRAAEVRAFLQEKLVPSAVGYLRKVLRLRDPVEGNLLLTRSCLAIRAGNPPECLQWNTNSCLEGTLDESFYAGRRTCSSTGSCTSVPDGKGVVDADLVIVITAVKSSLCTSSSALLALAQHCTQDPDTDRPTSGGVNFCPDNINTNYDDDITWLQQLNTAVHELVHVLGFSSSLFPYYRDAAGNPRTPRDAYGAPLGDSTIRTGADGVMKMVTPRVVEAARAQLSCASLDGAEVENYGGPATARSHWEARLWNSELMMGSISRDRVLSNLTLAALEDSGWYLPVWQQAALLRFGRGQGCAFALESCAPRANFPFVFAGEYCDGQPRYTTDNGQQLEMSDYCTANDYAVGFCTACTEGVASSTCLYDGCRTVQGYTRGRCDDLSNVGSSNNVNAPEYWGQRYSIASRCFPDGGASWVKREYRRPAQGAGCYPRRCERDTLEDGGYGPWRLLVEVGAGNWVRCVDGQVVDASQGSNPVSSFTTAVIGPCPVAADYCPFNSCPEECFRNGVCNNGRCNCYAGYEGNNCGLRLCLDGTCAPGQYCDVASGMCKWPVAPPPPEYLRRRVQVTGNVTFARGTTGSAAAVPTLVAQALHAALEGAEGVLSSTVDAEGSLADNGRRIRFHMTVEAYDDSEGLASFLDTLRGDPTPLFAGAPVLVAMSPATTLGLLVSETAPPSPPNPPPAPPSAPPPSPFSPPRSTDIAGISRTGFVIAMCGAGVGVVVVAAIIYLIAARRKTKRIIKEQEAVLRDIHSYFNTPVMTPRVGLSRAASGARSPFAAMDAGVGPDGAPISPRSTTMARSRLGTPLASPRASTPHAVSPFGAVPDAPPPQSIVLYTVDPTTPRSKAATALQVVVPLSPRASMRGGPSSPRAMTMQSPRGYDPGELQHQQSAAAAFYDPGMRQREAAEGLQRAAASDDFSRDLGAPVPRSPRVMRSPTTGAGLRLRDAEGREVGTFAPSPRARASGNPSFEFAPGGEGTPPVPIRSYRMSADADVGVSPSGRTRSSYRMSADADLGVSPLGRTKDSYRSSGSSAPSVPMHPTSFDPLEEDSSRHRGSDASPLPPRSGSGSSSNASTPISRVFAIQHDEINIS